MVVCLVGMCGSGKSEAADCFRKLGMKGIYFGELTLDRLRQAGLPLTPENEKKARQDIRDQYGMAAYAILAMDKLSLLLEERDDQEQPVFIDGLYSTEEYEFLEEKLPGKIILVEIYVEKDIRYRRLGQRPCRPLTFEQCCQRDWDEVKNLNKGGPIALSDYKINNGGGLEDLYKNLEATLEKIISKFRVSHESKIIK